MNSGILEIDFENLCQEMQLNLSKLDGSKIMITGATGLIGSNIVKFLLYYGNRRQHPPKVIALVRNKEKAYRLFSDVANEQLEYWVGDVTNLPHVGGSIDYIIHAASQTASKAFIHEPVETIKTAIDGTVNMLELAKEKKVKGFVYLSSMEVYGAPKDDTKIIENHGMDLDTTSVRSSYPEGKRMCETLCTAYLAQYSVPTKVVRLTQTFGPGVEYYDGRVFAEFARCAVEKKDIVLHTKGETKRSYLYTSDAVCAILTVLLCGETGQAYNAANENTYCSILEMAQLVAEKCANRQIDVKVQLDDQTKYGYAPVLKMNLATNKLQKLGWKPTVGLEEMFERMIAAWQKVDIL